MQYSMIRVANFEPLYLNQFWVKYKVSVLIELEIYWIFLNSSYFYL